MPLQEVELSSAVERGRDDCVHGIPLQSCPYTEGTVAAILWITAWIHEEIEDEEAIHALIQQRGRLGK